MKLYIEMEGFNAAMILLIKIFKIYFEQLESLGFSNNDPYLSEQIYNSIDNILKCNLSYKDNIADIFDTVYKINKFYQDLNLMHDTVTSYINIYNEHKSSIGRHMSDAYKISSLKLLDSINGAYKTYEDAFKKLHYKDFDITKVILSKIFSLYEMYIKRNDSNFVVDYYIYIMKLTVTNFSLTDLIMQELDAHKLQILMKYPYICEGLKENREVNVIQALVQKYGYPDKLTRPLPKLLTEISGGKTIEQAVKFLKTGFIILNKTTRNSIEYNIQELLNYAPGSIGVNEAILNVSNTIIRQTINQSTYSGIVTVSGGPNSKYFMLKTVDGINYRIFVHDVDLDLKKFPSLRLTKYNTILNNEILKYVGLSYVDKNEENITREQLINIRNLVTEKVINLFMAENDHDLKNIINKNYQLIFAVMIEQISMKLSKLFIDDKAKQWYKKITLSYYRDADIIQCNLRQDIMQYYNINPVLRARNLWINYLKYLLTEILNKYIENRNNIYLTLNKKIKIVNKIL